MDETFFEKCLEQCRLAHEQMEKTNARIQAMNQKMWSLEAEVGRLREEVVELIARAITKTESEFYFYKREKSITYNAMETNLGRQQSALTESSDLNNGMEELNLNRGKVFWCSSMVGLLIGCEGRTYRLSQPTDDYWGDDECGCEGRFGTDDDFGQTYHIDCPLDK